MRCRRVERASARFWFAFKARHLVKPATTFSGVFAAHENTFRKDMALQADYLMRKGIRYLVMVEDEMVIRCDLCEVLVTGGMSW